MLLKFPRFTKLNINHKDYIEEFTKQFPPYSDYHFTSLFAWNIGKSIEISNLNNNLVIKFRDYVNKEPFYSFIGNNNVKETIKTLLQNTQNDNLPQILKLIPEHSLSNELIADLDKEFNIIEDPDNHDYIVSVDELYKLEGQKLHHKRKLFNKFVREYSAKVVVEDIDNQVIQVNLVHLLHLWKKNKIHHSSFNGNEAKALKRALKSTHVLPLKLICVYIDNQLVGYSVFEIINQDYAVSSFQKANKRYRGIYEFLNYKIAEYLKEQGVKYINIEQDLGIEGLRQSKKPYLHSLLKKYIITYKS